MGITCYLSGLESFGVFIGAELAQSGEADLAKYKNSSEFYNKVSDDLDAFLAQHEYNLPNISKWFQRYVNVININLFREDVFKM